MLDDEAQLHEMVGRLPAAGEGGADAKTTAVVALLRTLAERARQMDPAERETTLRKLGGVAARLSVDEMLRLLARRDDESADDEVVAAVLDRMQDADVAAFVAASVVAERGATARLAHAFQALVPDTDRRRRLAALAEERAAGLEEYKESEEQDFEDLFNKVESMVSSYSDTNYVSEAYGRELWSAQTRAVDVEQAADDPPGRVGAWLSTVNDAALRGLDHVEADRRSPCIHAYPGRRGFAVAVLASEFLESFRLVRKQQPFLIEDHHARRSDAHDHVGLRVSLFCQHLGRDDAGGVAHPFQFDVGLGLVEAVGVSLELIGFQRRVDKELRFLGPERWGRESEDECSDSGKKTTWRNFHRQSPLGNRPIIEHGSAANMKISFHIETQSIIPI